MSINIKEIRELVQILQDSSVNEIEISNFGKKVKVSKCMNGVVATSTFQAPQQMTAAPAPAVKSAPTPEPVTGAKAPEEAKGTKINSPMVGTYYSSPSPEAESFIKVGDHVVVGQTLCIVEAMKIMNEIESEVSGVVVDILVENTDPVEYNQPLFIVET
jgi:acetyl-CoA carboxylase biotin carboxyl carrier protein